MCLHECVDDPGYDDHGGDVGGEGGGATVAEITRTTPAVGIAIPCIIADIWGSYQETPCNTLYQILLRFFKNPPVTYFI